MASRVPFRRTWVLTLGLALSCMLGQTLPTARGADDPASPQPSAARRSLDTAAGSGRSSVDTTPEPHGDLRPYLDAIRAGTPLPTRSPAQIQRDRGLQPALLRTHLPDAKSSGTALELIPSTNTAHDKGLLGCTNVIVNPHMDNDASGWQIFDPVVYPTAGPDQTLAMVDGADNGDTSINSDAFGQFFVIDPATQSLLIQLYIYYAPGSEDYADYTYFNFYADVGGSLGQLLYYQSLPEYDGGEWHWLTYTITDPAIVSSLVGVGDLDFVIDTVTDNLAPVETVYIDQVSVYTCNNTLSVDGQWTGGAGDTDFSDALTVLDYVLPDGSSETVAVTYANSDGTYSFDVAPLVGNGDAYQVWYINEGTSPQRLGFWARTKSTTVPIDQGATNLFNTNPLTPEHGETKTLPALFDWDTLSDDNYYLCFFDIEAIEKVLCTDVFPAQDPGPQREVTLAFLQSDPAFDFQFGRTYGWYIYVTTNTNGDLSENYGASFASNYITFVEVAPLPPPTGPGDDGQQLPGNTTNQSWVVMVYLAGDNDLGDPQTEYDPASKLTGHFDQLKQIAARYPNIHLVVLTDFYDTSGTQFCHLPAAAAPMCKQLGEQNTADPVTLANFVTEALDSFSADRTMFIFADHGHAIYGVGQDDTSSPNEISSITPAQLRQAFGSAGLGTSRPKLDVLFFETCLMGSIEAASDMSSYADYMVSGTDTLWMLPFYDRVLDLANNPGTSNSPATVAAGIAQAYTQRVRQLIPQVYTSAAAYDLSKAAAVRNAVNALGTALDANLVEARPVLTAIRLQQIQVYDSSVNFLHDRDEDAFIDLRHFATLLASAGNETRISADVKNAANGVLSTLGEVGPGFVIASSQTSGDNGEGTKLSFDQASGLFIFLPSGSANGEQVSMRSLYLGTTGLAGLYPGFSESGWGAFVQNFSPPSVGTARGPGRIARGGRPAARPFTTDLTRRMAFLPIVNVP